MSILKIISAACLKHSDSGEASKDAEARKIIQALQDAGYDIFEISKEKPQAKEAIKEVSEEELKEKFNHWWSDSRTMFPHVDSVFDFFKPHLKTLSISKEQGSEWISVETPPKLGGEYNVVWNLKDGEYPTVTSMDYDAINKIWTDPRGTGNAQPDVLFWQEKPEPHKGIKPEIWEIKEFNEPFTPKSLDDFERKVYGQCPHGENMTRCSECNPNQ